MNRRSLTTGLLGLAFTGVLSTPIVGEPTRMRSWLLKAVGSDPVPTPTGAPVVFYSPHQDDETLFMGQVIAHHAAIGREVHVVLACNGNLSDVCLELNGTIADNTWWGGTHYPEREGYEPLTREAFGLKRTEEFIAALGQLGVPRKNIHFGLPDGPATSDLLPDAISLAWATQLINGWANHFATLGYPHVGHYTMWWKDPHLDHAALGTAAHNLRTADPVKFNDVRWMVKPEQATAAVASAYAIPTTPATLKPLVTFMSKKAGLCYGAWCPPQSYAIGYHSVGNAGGYFTKVAAGSPNYIVRNL